MKKYNQIVKEIAKLEKQAEKARRDEIKSVVQQIKKLMSQHGITVADLAGGAGRKASAGKVAATKKTRASAGKKVAPKYRSKTDASQTWTGRGRQPRWVVDWIASGKRLDDLAI